MTKFFFNVICWVIAMLIFGLGEFIILKHEGFVPRFEAIEREQAEMKRLIQEQSAMYFELGGLIHKPKKRFRWIL